KALGDHFVIVLLGKVAVTFVLAKLAQGTSINSNNRLSARHCLERRNTLELGRGWHTKYRSDFVERHEIFIAHATSQRYAMRNAQIVRHCLKYWALRTITDNYKVNMGHNRLHTNERAKQYWKVLLGIKSAHVTNNWLVFWNIE